MKVKVLKLNDKAKLPFKKYKEDFCYDVVATSCEEVAPNVYKYGLGLAFQIERGLEEVEAACRFLTDDSTEVGYVSASQLDIWRSPINLSIDLRPRSSVWKTGMVLSNCVGTVN